MLQLKKKQILTEASKEDENKIKETEEAVEDDDVAQLADDGQVSEEALDAVIADQENQPEEEQVEEEIPQDDAEMYEDPNQMEELPVEEPAPIDNKFKNVKLYDNFIALRQYIQTYKDSYNNIEVDEITEIQVSRLAKLYDELRTLQKDLDFYIENEYEDYDYKKNLLTYLTYNKEFAEQISRFRHNLHLNPDKMIKDREEKKKK